MLKKLITSFNFMISEGFYVKDLVIPFSFTNCRQTTLKIIIIMCQSITPTTWSQTRNSLHYEYQNNEIYSGRGPYSEYWNRNQFWKIRFPNWFFWESNSGPSHLEPTVLTAKLPKSSKSITIALEPIYTAYRVSRTRVCGAEDMFIYRYVFFLNLW